MEEVGPVTWEGTGVDVRVTRDRSGVGSAVSGRTGMETVLDELRHSVSPGPKERLRKGSEGS